MINFTIEFLIFSLILILTFVSGFVCWKDFRFKNLSRKIFGPSKIPIIDDGVISIGVPPEKVLGVIFDQWFRTYAVNSVLKVWFGPELQLLTANLKDIEELMNKSKFIDCVDEYNLLKPWLREGLLISSGQKWFKRRKILNPGLHLTVLKDQIKIFNDHGEMLVEKLKKINNSNIDFYSLISLCTLDVICESAMGVCINAQSNSDSEYVKAVKMIATVIHKRMFDIVYRFNFIFKFTQLAKLEKQALKILHDFSKKVILQRRLEILCKAANNNKDEGNEYGVKRKMAFLDILLQSEVDGKPLTNDDIREEVDTFMFEGHDTTSSAILFFFYCIATNPHVQLKCFQEICEVLGEDKTKPITFQNLNDLHYVDLCVKETLRLYPSVPLLGRKITTESVINGKIIPAGTNIGISPLQLGRMEEIFPDANTFKPERFDVIKSAEKMNPYAYIPFSAGPRNCIGQKFAMLEIKSIAANVLRTFEIEYTGEDPILIAELILKVKDPLTFNIKERKNEKFVID